MLRLVHTADVHLGARHTDMGDAAAKRRERQFAAFRATVDLALSEGVDLFLVAGDLFDSNTQPRRTVERVAAELARLAERKIRSVLIPGTHDVYDRASLYRAYDLAELSGLPADTDLVTVLTPNRPEVVFAALDTIVYGRVFATKRAPASPLENLDVAHEPRARWRIGLVHGALLIPGRTEHDEVVFTRDEIAASGLDYLALGHWHSVQRGTAGATTYAYSGAPEPVALDQDGAGMALLVTLEERDHKRTVKVEERPVGTTRFEHVDIDAAKLAGQPELVERLVSRADPDLVLDVRLTGVRRDELDLEPAEVERELAPSFLRVRVRDASVAALPEEPLPPPDTILGALIGDLESRITAAEATGAARGAEEAGELRDALRLARLLLAGHEVTL